MSDTPNRADGLRPIASEMLFEFARKMSGVFSEEAFIRL